MTFTPASEHPDVHEGICRCHVHKDRSGAMHLYPSASCGLSAHRARAKSSAQSVRGAEGGD